MVFEVTPTVGIYLHGKLGDCRFMRRIQYQECRFFYSWLALQKLHWKAWASGARKDLLSCHDPLIPLDPSELIWRREGTTEHRGAKSFEKQEVTAGMAS